MLASLVFIICLLFSWFLFYLSMQTLKKREKEVKERLNKAMYDYLENEKLLQIEREAIWKLRDKIT